MENRVSASSRRGRRGFTFPVVLIVVGVLLLLNYANVLPWEMWQSIWPFWPVVLILIGFDLALGRVAFAWLATPVALLLGAGLVGGLVWHYQGWTPPPAMAVTREVSGFDRIVLSGPDHLIVTQGDTESLRIEANEKTLQHVTTEVRNHVLYVGRDGGPTWRPIPFPWTDVKIYVTAKDIRGITLSGSGEFSSAGIKTDTLDIAISGSGDGDLAAIEAESVTVNVSGSGEVALSGRADRQKVEIRGSGEYKSRHLVSRAAHVTVTGSGDAEVNATEQLNVRVTGSGDVRYVGSPSVDQQVSGSGDLRRIGD